MNTLWAKILGFIAKLFGANVAPPEVLGSDQNLENWWAVYRSKAPWLSYDYVTADAKKRNRRRKTLNGAKIVCSELAGLVMAEEPLVDAGDLVDQVIERHRLWDNLKKTVEYQAALGGQAIKVTIEPGETGDQTEIGLDFVKAMAFVPLVWDNSRVVEAAFIDRRVIDKKTLVRVETHRRGYGPTSPDQDGGPVPTGPEGYVITNRVFDEQTQLEVPLSTFDSGLVPEAFLPVTKPLFAYIRNPEANNIDPESPLGMSVFGNAMDTLEVLDLAYDAFKTEILMGRQRVAIPGLIMRGYVDPETKERRMGFDPTDEAYVRFEGDDTAKLVPTDLSGQLRVEELRRAIQTNLDLLSIQTGFSPGYLTFDGTGALKTATEVISDASKTFKTVAGLRGALDQGLKAIFAVINELGAVYNIPGAVSTEPQITWDDSVIESRDARADYWLKLLQGKLTDRSTALMQVHGITEEAAKAMADKIKNETAVVVDPFGAGPGA